MRRSTLLLALKCERVVRRYCDHDTTKVIVFRIWDQELITDGKHGIG